MGWQKEELLYEWLNRAIYSENSGLTAKNRLILRKLNAPLILALFLLTPLNQAQAGFFSFSTSVSAQEGPRTYPSQSSAVLLAAINIDPNPIGEYTETFIDNGALVAVTSHDGISLAEAKVDSDQIARYTVRPGDNLSSIAKMFGVSVNTIRWSNDISSGNTIRVGQELVILPVDGVRYVVKRGDTLASIAKKHKGDVGEIVNFNGLSLDEDLLAGQVIVIPDGVIVPVPLPRPSSAGRIAEHSGPALSGYFLRPVSGARTQGLHGNNGIDIGAPTGVPVSASASGEVIIARGGGGWNGGYGNMIVISHPNGTQTLYAHLSRVDVVPGQYVAQGQNIGAVGSTGRSTGPHLHFEVRGAKNPF